MQASRLDTADKELSLLCREGETDGEFVVGAIVVLAVVGEFFVSTQKTPTPFIHCLFASGLTHSSSM